MTGLLVLALLLPAAAQAASKRPALHPHLRLTGRPAPHQLVENLVKGSGNVRALHAHLKALDKDDPRQFKEWVFSLRLLSRESAVLRHDLIQGRAAIKNGVELDPRAVELSVEPGPPLDLPAQTDADGARVALALAAVEEAEPMAAAILLRAQGEDQLDRITAFEAAADDASLRVAEQRAQLVRVAGAKAADELPAAGPKRAAPSDSAVTPAFMNMQKASEPSATP